MNKKLFAGAVFTLALVGASTVSAFTFDSKIDTLQEKKDLQTTLNMATGSTLSVDGVLGKMTTAALKAFQTLKGLTADGVAGPLTRAALTAASTGTTTGTGALCPNGMTLASNCVTAPGTTTTVTGGAGDISTSTVATDIENKIIEGQSDVKNLGFKIEASDSDIKVTNMKVTMTKSGTGSTYLDRYISDVSVWMNGSKVATVSASDFSKDVAGTYSKSIALSNAVIKEGSSNKATFYITTSGISNIDTADMTAFWAMKVDNIRFTDGTGAIMTYGTALNSNSLDVSDIAATGDVKLVVSKGSATPLAGNVEVSTTGSTSDVLMLEVKAKNTGADMTFDELKFNLTSDASGLNTVLGELILKEGSTELANLSTFATGATQQVTFSLDDTYTIKAGDTKYFRVYATINDADNFPGGNGLTVSYVAGSANLEIASTRTAFTSETGSSVGEKQSFYSQGAVVKFVSDSYTAPDFQASTQGTIALTFTVTAFGDNDVIINKDATSGATSVIATVTGGTPSGTIVTESGVTADGAGNFTVSAGDTKTFTISKKLPSVSGFVSMKITSVAGNAVSNVETRQF